MKRFQFKLATVLKVRCLVEEERQRQLQQAETILLTAQQQLLHCQTELTGTMREYQRRMQERFDRYVAEDYEEYVGWLQQKIKVVTEYIAQCEAEVAQARQALMLATQERKIVDKLKEQAYQHYQQEELKADINFLDELGTGRFVRRETEQVREDR